MRSATVFAILALPAFGTIDPKCSAGDSCDAASLLQSGGVRMHDEIAAERQGSAETEQSRQGAAENVAVPVMAPMKLLEALQIKGNSAVPHLTTNEAHHHTVQETGLLQEKATLFKVDAQAEGRGVSQAAVFIFATIVISLVLAVAWMAIKQVFGIGCSEEAVDDSDFAAGVKRLLGLAPSEAATAGDDLIVKGPPLYGEPAGEGGDAIKSDVVKDTAKGAAETKARSPLEELRVKMQEADLTKEAALALSEKIAAKDSQ